MAANPVGRGALYLCSICCTRKLMNDFSLTQQKQIKRGKNQDIKCKACTDSLTRRKADPPCPIVHSYEPGKPEKPGCFFCGHRLRWCCYCCYDSGRRGRQKRVQKRQPQPSCICSSCQAILPKTSFSRSNWRKRCKDRARCIACVTNAIDERAQEHHQSTQKLRRAPKKKSPKNPALFIEREDSWCGDSVDNNGSDSDHFSDDSGLPLSISNHPLGILPAVDLSGIGIVQTDLLMVTAVKPTTSLDAVSFNSVNQYHDSGLVGSFELCGW